MEKDKGVSGQVMRKPGVSPIEVFKYKMLIVGMVNILAVSFMLGIQGAGYLGISLAFLSIGISLHSLWLSSVVTKYVRGRIARGQYRNSGKFLKGALLYAILTGLIWCILFIVFGNWMGNFLVRDVHIGICLMLAAPILTVYAISEALGGYFRGIGMAQPVKISMIVRQAVFFICSIIGLKYMGGYGGKISKLLHNEAVTCVYGAFGVMLGLLAGNLAGLLLLLIFRLLLHGEIQRMKKQDTVKHQETVFQGFCTVLGAGVFQGLKWMLVAAPLPLNYILYVRLCKKDVASTAWIKTGGYLFGMAVPVMLLLVLGYAILNYKSYRRLSHYYKNEINDQFQDKLNAILLGIFALVFPICAAFAVMAEPVAKLLTGGASKEGSSFLLLSAIGAVLLTLEIVILRLMQIWNETLYSLLALLAGFAVQTVIIVIAFQTIEAGPAGIFIGMLLQSAIVLLMFFLKSGKRLKLSGYFLKKLIMTGIIALASALIMLLLYELAGKKLPAAAAIAVSVIPGFLVYLAGISVLHIISAEEAERMPGGALFLQINRILHRE